MRTLLVTLLILCALSGQLWAQPGENPIQEISDVVFEVWGGPFSGDPAPWELDPGLWEDLETDPGAEGGLAVTLPIGSVVRVALADWVTDCNGCRCFGYIVVEREGSTLTLSLQGQAVEEVNEPCRHMPQTSGSAYISLEPGEYTFVFAAHLHELAFQPYTPR